MELSCSSDYLTDAKVIKFSFLSKWNKNFSTRGVNGLKIAYKGKPSYLSQSDKEEIIKKAKSEGNVGFGRISYPYRVKIRRNLSVSTKLLFFT